MSVHHAAYPKVDPSRADEEIRAEMRAIQRLVNLALSAREAKKLKVRQPLAKLAIGPADETEAKAAARFAAMLLEELNVKAVEVAAVKAPSPVSHGVTAVKKSLAPKAGRDLKAILDAVAADSGRLAAALLAGGQDLAVSIAGRPFPLAPEDLSIVAVAPEGTSVAEDAATWVALDVRITEELKVEGLMREMLRRLQVLRKDTGLMIEDRIRLRWQSASAAIAKAFAVHGEFMGAELLCVELTRDEALAGGAEIEADGEKLSVTIEKVA